MWSALSMIIAVILAPILAVQVQKYLERGREVEERRLRIFKALMATRASVLSPLHVESLNLIDVEFYGTHPKDKKVVETWKLYLDHLNNFPKEEGSISSWHEKSVDLLADLLYEMGQAVGYHFDKVHIKRSAYIPKGHSDFETENTLIRRGLLEIISGRSALPMDVRNFPVSQEEVSAQRELRDELMEYLRGKRPIPIKILKDQKESLT
ncbi:MAG: DUF6680 family protein [Desulfobaccales bacterium]